LQWQQTSRSTGGARAHRHSDAPGVATAARQAPDGVSLVCGTHMP
jgi:hypothetical protein